MLFMNGYSISRNWWDFAFANPEKIKPVHSAILFFAMEHCNRLGWKEKFGLPSSMAMEAIGVHSYNTYVNAFNDLCEWGFFDLIQKSKNQYSSNIIALSKIDEAQDKALDKALTKHTTKQRESIDSIDKQVNNKPSKRSKQTVDLNPPSLEEVVQYFKTNGYSEEGAGKAYRHYSTLNWHTSQGKKISNWKNQMANNWFKDEFKIQTTQSTQYAQLT